MPVPTPKLPKQPAGGKTNQWIAPPIRNSTDAEKLLLLQDLEALLNMTEDEVFATFAVAAVKQGYKVENHKDDWFLAYHLVEGIKPIFITAHVDTVRHTTGKLTLVSDRQNGRLCSAKPDIIGADDRSGCLIILHLLETLRDKSVIFCLFNGEEVGGIGSSLFCELEDNPWLKEAKLFIGLDRGGFDEYVSYDFDNAEIDEAMSKLGYAKAHGSFSDVMHLANTTGTACINLSAGFTGAHTIQETAWLYPILRAIDSIPQLNESLENKTYPADDWRPMDDDEDRLPNTIDAEEFIEELSIFGLAYLKGYELTCEDVFGIINEYFDDFAPATPRKQRTRHPERRIHEVDDSIYPFTSMLPF